MDAASYPVATPDKASGSSGVGRIAGNRQSLPPDGEVTGTDAVFLRLLQLTDDPQVRGFLRRILAV